MWGGHACPSPLISVLGCFFDLRVQNQPQHPRQKRRTRVSVLHRSKTTSIDPRRQSSLDVIRAVGRPRSARPATGSGLLRGYPSLPAPGGCNPADPTLRGIFRTSTCIGGEERATPRANWFQPGFTFAFCPLTSDLSSDFSPACRRFRLSPQIPRASRGRASIPLCG